MQLSSNPSPGLTPACISWSYASEDILLYASPTQWLMRILLRLAFRDLGQRCYPAKDLSAGRCLTTLTASLGDFMMTLPDTPPTPGYVPANYNSLLDWTATHGRALPVVPSWGLSSNQSKVSKVKYHSVNFEVLSSVFQLCKFKFMFAEI